MFLEVPKTIIMILKVLIMSNKKDRHYDKALYRLLTIMVMVLKDERPTIKSLAEEFNTI